MALVSHLELSLHITVGILELPDEVLRKIFSYLPVRNILSVVIDVCTRWKNIVENDYVFWKNIRVVIDCDKFINTSILNLSSGRVIKESTLEDEDTVFIGEHDLERVSSVQSIKFKNGYKAVSRPFEFELDTVYSYQALLLVRIIDKISKCCKNVETVEFSRCIGVAYKGTLAFLNEKYDHINKIKFDVSCILTIPYEELTKYSNLNTIISHDYKFKRSDLCCLVDGCSQLSSLWIILARYIKNDDVIYLLEKKKCFLKELGLGLTVSDEVINKVKECNRLTVLFFSDARCVSANGISILTNMSSIRYISLHRAKLQPTAIKTWISSSSIFQQLIVLDLTDYNFKDISWVSHVPQNCRVTFSNNIDKAIHEPYKHYQTQIHWMYSNLLVGK